MKARLPKEYQPKSQAELLRQAQEMQMNMEKMQAELEEKEYTAQAGGGMVKVTVTGKHNITSLQINPDLIEDAQEDPEMLEDLIITAVNQAVNAATEESESAMSGMTAGLNIPGLF
ncbi:MAG: YbaB/EbfC family nucleoid-associated protein [Clostridia bacterium]|nr:YbaB/EbfC family nucleoid-associated protein [Clostridia bacterium]